jgi:hypothetical protein
MFTNISVKENEEKKIKRFFLDASFIETQIKITYEKNNRINQLPVLYKLLCIYWYQSR